MEEKSIEKCKKLVADFRLLTTKVQKDNQRKSKNLKETNPVLEACKKEYQKLYFEHETLKKKFTEQQEEFLKCQNNLKNRTASNTKKQDRKINFYEIKFDKNKFKKLFAMQKKRDVIMIIFLTMITS